MGIEKLQIEQSEISKIQVGAGLSLDEWANLVHPQSDGYVTVATKNAAGEWTEKSYPSGIWIEKLVQHKDLSCYVSVNSFFIPKRNNSNARQINAFYVDLDHYKEFLSQEDVLDAIDFLVKTERLPEPTMIIDSGRGLYGVVPSKRTFYTLRLKTLIYIGSINQYPKRVYVIFFGNLILVCVLVRKLSYIHHKFNSYGDYFKNVPYWLSLSV